ncbi:MAG: hypothetical protein ACREMF_01400 [Gemmatimonadales bacterium]
MRGITVSLAAVLTLGVVLLSRRATAADRSAHWRVTEPRAAPAAVPADKVWYGGTLAPITVEGVQPRPAAAHPAHDCAAVES